MRALLAVFAAIVIAAPSLAEDKPFLKLDGIKGESQDAKHKDEIHIESAQSPRGTKAGVVAGRARSMTTNTGNSLRPKPGPR